MRSLLVAAVFFTAAASLTVAANADVVTIGRATFDFDAPSSPLMRAVHHRGLRQNDREGAPHFAPLQTNFIE